MALFYYIYLFKSLLLTIIAMMAYIKPHTLRIKFVDIQKFLRPSSDQLFLVLFGSSF